MFVNCTTVIDQDLSLPIHPDVSLRLLPRVDRTDNSNKREARDGLHKYLPQAVSLLTSTPTMDPSPDHEASSRVADQENETQDNST